MGSACNDPNQKYKDAIKEFHKESVPGENTGKFAVNSINILEIKEGEKGFKYILANVKGKYTPAPTSKKKAVMDSENTLWFILIETNNEWKVAAVRDPDTFDPDKP